MCCFSRPVERVEQTRIYARGDGARQLVVYELRLTASEDLAMVLPVPVAAGVGEDAVGFVDLTSSPTFFRALDYAFRPPTKLFGLEPQAGRPGSNLVVHQVGSFEASFVPRAGDFDRLDPRFSIPSALWESVPSVRGFGFVVFKMRAPAAPKRGLFDRVLGAKPPVEPRVIHPMAFWFPRADATRTFFPTLHVHDCHVHESASFNHVLYAQSAETPTGWERSSYPMQDGAWGTGRDLLLPGLGHRLTLSGSLPNADVWING